MGDNKTTELVSNTKITSHQSTCFC